MAEEPKEMSTAERIAERNKIVKDVKRLEEVSTPGANVLAPKQALLDARDVEAKRPDKRVRWVSLRNPDKMLARKSEGYSIVPESEGGRRLGDDLVLMEIDRKVYDARVARQEKMNKDRLKQHKTEMEGLAERMAKQLRDQGIDIDVNRLLVNEGA